MTPPRRRPPDPMLPLERHLSPPHHTVPQMCASALAADPDAVVIHAFDRTWTYAEVDAEAHRLARALAGAGVAAGDRVALFVQNDPIFVTGLLAAWKLGAIGVPINPMNTGRELAFQLEDSAAVALIALPGLWTQVAQQVVADGIGDVRLAILAPHTAWRQDGEQFETSAVPVPPELLGCVGSAEVVSADALPHGSDYTPGAVCADDVALLTYTSGTTGRPKGAMNTHGNLTFNAETYVQMSALQPGEPILAIAPLFHITGMVGHVLLGLRVGAPIVLSHRFHPQVMLESIRHSRPVFTIGAITALMALADCPAATAADFASLRTIYSGGAPIAPALADRLEGIFGTYVHNVYGMSETSSPTHLVPRGQRAPVDPVSGALSVGRPVYDTQVRIADEQCADVQAGTYGEILVRGPQITPGYWNRPDATAESFADGWLRTGDIGFVDADGWYYLVDRKKDMINASGYKVWPREVEDVLYTHPAVAEAAVVGAADAYRGETVIAFVTLHEGRTVNPSELIDFCKADLAAYKYPRSIEILDEMPKTATGKILRRKLRGS